MIGHEGRVAVSCSHAAALHPCRRCRGWPPSKGWPPSNSVLSNPFTDELAGCMKSHGVSNHINGGCHCKSLLSIAWTCRQLPPAHRALTATFFVWGLPTGRWLPSFWGPAPSWRTMRRSAAAAAAVRGASLRCRRASFSRASRLPGAAWKLGHFMVAVVGERMPREGFASRVRARKSSLVAGGSQVCVGVEIRREMGLHGTETRSHGQRQRGGRHAQRSAVRQSPLCS